MEFQEIADRRAQIDSGALVAIRARRLISENVLPVIDLEGADIFPLGIANLAFVMNGDPTALADRDPITPIRFPKPRDDLRRLRAVHATFHHIVVRKSDVKRIERRGETDRKVAIPMIRLVITSKI